jgi:7-carboxy-7-deazaguanine synthase
MRGSVMPPAPGAGRAPRDQIGAQKRRAGGGYDQPGGNWCASRATRTTNNMHYLACRRKGPDAFFLMASRGRSGLVAARRAPAADNLGFAKGFRPQRYGPATCKSASDRRIAGAGFVRALLAWMLTAVAAQTGLAPAQACWIPLVAWNPHRYNCLRRRHGYSFLKSATGQCAGAVMPDDTLLVNEIFYSIQGEGTRAGLPCVFIRLTGCNLRCKWCDTAYAFSGGQWMPVELVVEQAASYGCNLVEVTGGEPLLQAAVYGLLARLADRFSGVLLETSGAFSIERVDPRVVRIVDVKCPGSGEQERNYWPNMDLLTPKDEVKFVISDRADYDWAVGVLRRFDLPSRCAVIFAPVFGGLSAAELAGWILEDRLAVRLGMQLHKLIWPGRDRGV